MRFTVSAEQQKFFNLNGYIEFEDLISEQERSSLIKAIDHIRQNSPGYPEQNLARSIPEILPLIRKKEWGRIAWELIKKKPLRLTYDLFSTSLPTLPDSFDESSCGLLLCLDTTGGIFFKNSLPESVLYNSKNSCYFLLIFTANHLQDPQNPVVFQ